VRVFELMPLYLKMEVVEHGEVVQARDLLKRKALTEKKTDELLVFLLAQVFFLIKSASKEADIIIISHYHYEENKKLMTAADFLGHKPVVLYPNI